MLFNSEIFLFFVLATFAIYYLCTLFREEYRPASVLVNSLKNQSKPNLEESRPVEQEIQNSEFREQFIERMVEGQKEKLSPEDEKILREESASIQSQIAELQQDGVQIVLFSFPAEPSLTNTTKRKQIRELMRSLFPSDRFEWLPEPPSINWTTSDGIHLVPSDAKVYAEYIKAQLLSSSF